MKNLSFIILLIIAISLLTFACTSSPPTQSTPTQSTPTQPTPTQPTPTQPTPTQQTPTQQTPTQPTPTPIGTPKYGGTLRILATAEYAMNLGAPYINSPVWNPYGASPTTEKIVRWDEKGNVYPFLASGWEWDDDYTSIIFTFREGIKFHDGTDFNAEAAQFCLQVMKDSATSWGKSIASMEVIDPLTLKINLNKFDNVFLTDMASTLGATFSPTAYNTYGGDYLITNPVGTGPFICESYQRDVSAKFVKNNDYWQEGKPYLDGLEFNFVADAVTGKLSFLAGEADMYNVVSPSDALDIQSRSDARIPGAATYSFEVCGDGLNPESPFADVRVRKAISYAIDSKAITDSVGSGILEVSTQGAQLNSWSYNPDLKSIPYDPTKAKQLLTDAGYPEGFTTNMWYEVGISYYEQTFVAIQQYLEAVGIKINMQPLSSVAYNTMKRQGWKDGLMEHKVTIPIGYSPITAFLRGLTSTTSYTPSYGSIYNSDAVVDKVLAAIVEPDQEKMQQLIRDAQVDAYVNDCVTTPIFITKDIVAKRPYCKDDGIREPWGSEWTPENAWLDK
jgi:peptide/nickel transport system substrate-binding protein